MLQRLFVSLTLVILAAGCRKQDTVAQPETPKTIGVEKLPADRFEPIAGFPAIKDTASFVGSLEKQLSGYKHRDTKILRYEKIRLYGTDNELILLEFAWESGSGADYPWKNQYLFALDGEFLGKLDALRYDFVRVFKSDTPLLLTVHSTSKGNGWHGLYRFKNDSLENVYDGVSDYYPKTYDIHEDHTINDPSVFRHVVKDYNNDGYNDLALKGDIVLIMGMHDGNWFDSQIINGKTYEYSKKKPFKKIPAALIFLYDPKTEHFTQKEDYSKKYIDMLFHNSK